MVEFPRSRFALKRSTSLDSIQTGLNNIITRMHFSQARQQGLDDSSDDGSIDALRELEVALNDRAAALITPRTMAPTLLNEPQRDLTGEKSRGDGRIPSKRFSTNYVHEEKLQPRDYDQRQRLPRRSVSYYDEYNKRESERQKARATAACLVRAQKVKKEFSDGNNLSSSIARSKKSSKTTNQRSNKNRTISQKTNAEPIPTDIEKITSKIRLHTKAKSLPSSSKGISLSSSSRICDYTETNECRRARQRQSST